MAGTTKKSKKRRVAARHGALTAPIFAGGGVTFAAEPPSSRRQPQAVSRRHVRHPGRAEPPERLTIVESFDVDATSQGSDRQAGWPGSGQASADRHRRGFEHLYLSARNLPYVQVRDVQGLDRSLR